MLWIIAYAMLAAPAPIDSGLKLIAHRGGIVDEQHPENSQAGLDAAIAQHYWMVELDLRRTRDGVTILQHDPNFIRIYGSSADVSASDWKSVARLWSRTGHQHPVTFRHVAECCRGKIQVMLDLHEEWPEDALRDLEDLLRRDYLLDSAIFIGAETSKAYFKGKARVEINLQGLRKAVASGEDVSSLYCLFAHGNELDDEAIQYAASVHVPVVASVNTYHYMLKPKSAGAEADINRLHSAGVRLFQIDSVYAPFFEPFKASAFQTVDDAQDWLWEHPADGANNTPRRERMAVIQAAADACSADVAKRFRMGTQEDATLEEQYGILHAQQRAAAHVIDEVRRTRVKSGVVLWLCYNMGYVAKTPNACFGIDICMRDARPLAALLDFLLITHPHLDHLSGSLSTEMAADGKPVISSFFENGTIVKEPWEHRFGPVDVKVDIGDHSPKHPDGVNNMLMYRIACGRAGDGAIIYHSGDGANYDKMTPGKPVDVFIPHVACSGMNIADAVRHVNPKYALISHLLELTHPKGGARWSYDYAFDAIKDLPESQTRILVWGERFSLPDTKFEMEPAR